MHPDVVYVKARQQGRLYWVAEDLASQVLGEDYEVVQTARGRDLEGIEYISSCLS